MPSRRSVAIPMLPSIRTICTLHEPGLKISPSEDSDTEKQMVRRRPPPIDSSMAAADGRPYEMRHGVHLLPTFPVRVQCVRGRA